MKRIILINPKGGCGKSSISTNLAGYYASRGLKVVIVDMDSQKSAVNWLKIRPEECQPIALMTIRKMAEANHDEIDYVIIDTPANIGSKQIAALLTQADVMLIPVLPSPTDIHVVGHFVFQLLLKHKVIYEDKPIAVVANRSRVESPVYAKLVSFLNDIKYPFIATLRDSDNYLTCAGDGKSIFEHDETMRDDCDDWLPMIEWIDRQ